MLALASAGPAGAADARLAQYLAAVQPGEIVPGADRFGPLQGNSPVVPAYAGDKLLGYAFLNADVVNATGYSGRPISIVVGLGRDAVITGAKLVDHHEPIVLVGIPLERITRFIQGYVGMSVLQASSQSAARPPVDIVSGATVTVMVIGDTLMRSGNKVARALGLGGTPAAAPEGMPAATKTIDLSQSGTEDWTALLGDGSVRRLALTVGEVNAAFERAGNAAAARPEDGAPDDTFIDLYVGLATIPTIGRSLLGDAGYEMLVRQLKPGQQAIVVAATGHYSFKGSGYVRGGIFDRIALIQAENTVRFRDRNHRRLGNLAAAGAPDLPEIGLFTIPDDSGFDPTQPWRLQLLVQRSVGALEKAFITFDLGYMPPEKFLKVERTLVTTSTPEPAEPAASGGIPAAEASATAVPGEVPLWQRIWESRRLDVGITAVLLAVVTGIFFFQDGLVRRPKLYGRLRLGVLTVTLLWLGWWVHAQLSVVNVLTFANALRTDFRWDYFLMEPLLFVLWCAVAAALLFWGRGAFCGWLCPFGALQELSNRLARALKVPQIPVPFGLHQRLWPIKYMIFLGLFGLSLYSLSMAERASEVEPFKTAIVLIFVRSWPFVAFAGALLMANLFIERFFCRYLCPLGAALAIPARLRMFDWLRRYRECGNPCQRCANECPVQCIHPEGHINPNECIQCLNCQVLYHHDRKCPVVIQKRLKREKREALSSPSMRPGRPPPP